jgi:hypothetical protein
MNKICSLTPLLLATEAVDDASMDADGCTVPINLRASVGGIQFAGGSDSLKL